MSSAASYSSLRARGSCIRRSRFSAQSRAHIRGFVASRPRSRRVVTARRSEASYTSSCSRSCGSGHSERAAACQWPMNARRSLRSMASRECASNPNPASQLSGTADGRVVTT
ncbi:thrombospondin type-1 domain-containing protein [Streptomyces sp. NPDC079167]